MFVVAAAALGTLLTPFAVVLNNHLIAAVSAAVALDAFVRIWFDGERRWWYFAVAGWPPRSRRRTSCRRCRCWRRSALLLFAATRRGRWLAGSRRPPLVVVAAFFATNYVAHDSLRPPYMHRSATDPADNWYDYTYTFDGRSGNSYWLDPQGIDRGEPSKARYALHVLVGHHGIFSLTPVWLLERVGSVALAPRRRPSAATSWPR